PPPCWAATTQQVYGQRLPAKAIAPALAQGGCGNVETFGSVNSVNNGLEGAVLLDAGNGRFAIHADGFGRTADDYRIPSYPYLFVPGRPFNGRQPNSSLRADGGSIGASYFFPGGYIGAALIQNDTLYHIPGIDGEDHNTRIDAHQTKFTSKGEYRPDGTIVDAIRFWAGATDYRHKEIGLADPADFTTDGVRQIFTHREQEGRVETQ